MNNSQYHIPVMLRETIRSLNIKQNGIYIDCTFGCGGHTKDILKKLNQYGKLIVIDKDNISCNLAKTLNDNRILIFNDNFSNIYKIIKKLKLIGKIDGIIADLGPSSLQIDTIQRGFSFKNDGPLDMRMNTNNKLNASFWLLKTNEKNISKILFKYGNERNAKKIAYEIKKFIKKNSYINSTLALSNLISKFTSNKKKHPATRSFMAIRMFINNEINELNNLLSSCYDILSYNGILCIISFNSTERKEISHFYYGEKNKLNNNKKLIIKFQLKPSFIEEYTNNRARSSLLTVFQKNNLLC